LSHFGNAVVCFEDKSDQGEITLQLLLLPVLLLLLLLLLLLPVLLLFLVLLLLLPVLLLLLVLLLLKA
jgi:hypothetical protein